MERDDGLQHGETRLAGDAAIGRGADEQGHRGPGAYYALLPVSADPLDRRAFPQTPADQPHIAKAAQLVTLGDGQRGIPPCQSCLGPVGYKNGAPLLATQNAVYLLRQLEGFANGSRSNDINVPMRSIAIDLTQGERQALAEYYGAGYGQFPASTLLRQQEENPAQLALPPQVRKEKPAPQHAGTGFRNSWG